MSSALKVVFETMRRELRAETLSAVSTARMTWLPEVYARCSSMPFT